MNEEVRELVAIGASVGAHCQPCLEHHVAEATRIGVSAADIHEAIEIGHKVEKGAMVAMMKFSAKVEAGVDEPVAELDAAGATPPADTDSRAADMVLRIFDPAMCCATGVCGPSVDPNLARFAGILNELKQHPGLAVERFNLSQQPEAFANDAEVRVLLADGGEQNLPFIFIDGRLCFQGRYPSREELQAELGLQLSPDSAFPQANTSDGPCCAGDSGSGGCCS